MITVSKIGRIDNKLKETSFVIEDEYYYKANQGYCEMLLKNLNATLKCNNPLYVVWEKYTFTDKLTAKELMNYIV